mmetsp:Transcript_83421/g.241025  ORF Transcript_83421/g.241025 Transcript_83421/m.241025 type:complete len:222 (-) Transcript_83421:123-788(-)
MEDATDRGRQASDKLGQLGRVRRQRPQGKVLGNEGVWLRQVHAQRRTVSSRGIGRAVPGTGRRGPRLAPRLLQGQTSHGRAVRGVLLHAPRRENFRLVPHAHTIQGQCAQHFGDARGVILVHLAFGTQHLLGRVLLQGDGHVLAKFERMLVLAEFELDLGQLAHLFKDPLLRRRLLQHGNVGKDVSTDLLQVVQALFGQVERDLQEAEGTLKPSPVARHVC